jgi:hypothetical protein
VVQEEMKKNAFFLLFPRNKSISFKAFGQVRLRHQLVQEEMKKNAFIIIIIIIFIRAPPNRYRTRQTYTRTKYVQ